MPPRKSNISQATATEDGGTPTKEREGGTNIEVQYHSPYSPLPLGPPLVPISSSPQTLQATSPTPNAPPLGSHDQPLVVDDDEDDDSLIVEVDTEDDDPQDLSLPRTMVQRLAKGVLPPNTSLHKDAVLALSKGATVFINYLAQAAHESNQSSKSYRTIPPGAVLEALHDLEFEPFVPRVDAELRKFNEVQTGKRNEYRRKVKEEKTGKKIDGEGGADTTLSGGDGEGGEGEERASKRIRREEGGEGMTMSPEVGDGSEQLRQQLGQHDGDEEEDEDFDAPDEPEEAEEGAEGESSNNDLRQRKEEDEDEDEEEDEDAYPDEGRRLSSVEREAFDLEHSNDPITPSGSSGEEESD